ncbi:Carbonic anhydrase [Balamuthia mandrillaris]
MDQIQSNRALKVALAAAEHIFDEAKSKKSLPPRETLPYFVLTKQDLPAAHAKSFTLNAFRQDLSLVEHMSIDVISQLAAENRGLISKTDFRLLHPLAPAIQKQLVFYYYIPMVVSPPSEVNTEQSKTFLRFCRRKAQNEGIIQELGDIVANGLRCHGSIVEGPWIVNGLENPRWKWLAQSIRKGHWDVLHQAALGLDRGKEVLPPMDSSQQQQPLDATSSQSSSSSSSSNSRFYETPTGSWIRNLINAAVYSILKEVPSSDERRNRKGRVFQGSFTREELLLVYRQLPLGLQKLFMLIRAKTIQYVASLSLGCLVACLHAMQDMLSLPPLYIPFACLLTHSPPCVLAHSDSATHEENTRLPPLRQEWLNESSLADALMSSIPSKPTTSSHRTKVQQEMISEGGEEEEEEEEEEGEEQQQQQQQQEAVVIEEDPKAFLHPPLDRQQLEQAARMEAMVEKQYSAKEKLFQYRMKLTHYRPPFTVQEALAENALNFASLKSLKGMRISTSINLSGPLEDVKRLMLAVRRCLVKEAQQHNTPLELDPLDRKLWKTRIRHPVRSQLERVWPYITLEKSRKPERWQSKSKSKSKSSSSSSSSKSKNKSKASSSSATANMPAEQLYNAAAIVRVKDLPELDAISPLVAD